MAMKTTPIGRRLIQAFESCMKAIPGRPGWFKAYLDVVGVVTIGWGTTRSDVPDLTLDTEWSQQRCDDVFAASLGKYERYVAQGAGGVALHWFQFDALVSWVYNCGYSASSAVWKAIAEGNHDRVPVLLARWNKAGGKVYNGLVRRRKAEGELYTGDVDAASRTAQVRLSAPDEPMPQKVDTPVPTAGDLVGVAKGPIAGATASGGGAGAATASWWDALPWWSALGLAIAGAAAVCYFAWQAVKIIKYERANWA